MNPSRHTVLIAATAAALARSLPATAATEAAAVTPPYASYWDPDSGSLRFAWSTAPGGVRHHTLHRLLPDGTRRFLGATGQRACYLTGLQPEQGEAAARFEVRAVGELYTSSDPVTVTHTW